MGKAQRVEVFRKKMFPLKEWLGLYIFFGCSPLIFRGVWKRKLNVFSDEITYVDMLGTKGGCAKKIQQNWHKNTRKPIDFE